VASAVLVAGAAPRFLASTPFSSSGITFKVRNRGEAGHGPAEGGYFFAFASSLSSTPLSLLFFLSAGVV